MNKVVIGALHLLGLYSEDEVADTIPAPPPEQPMRADIAAAVYEIYQHVEENNDNG